MKQSSLEWLFDELINRTDKSFFLEELIQAKEMHKQEIIEAWENGYREFYDGSSNPNEYYKKTYEKEN